MADSKKAQLQRTKSQLDRRLSYTALARYSLKRENSQFLSRLPLIREDESINSMSAQQTSSPVGSEPAPVTSPKLRPIYVDRRRSSRRFQRSELSQLLQQHRGSFLSTASLALVGMAPARLSRSSSTAGEKDNDSDDETTQGSRTCWRRTKQIVQYLYEKSRIKQLLPLLILFGYSVLGGAVVYWIEAPIERWQMEGKQRFLNEQKLVLTQTLWEVRENGSDKDQALMTLRQSVYWYTITTMYMQGNFTRLPPPASEVLTKVRMLKKYTEEMAQRCWEIRLDLIYNLSDAERMIEEALGKFEFFTGVSTELRPIWTFSNAIFLALTIYTTIGYGSVAPHTVAGRVATIIYAIIGIPIYVIFIHKLGRLCLKLLHKFWSFSLRLARNWICAGQSRRMKKQDETEDEKAVNNIPVSLAVGVTFGWMIACAGVCSLGIEKSWDYFTSFYFFFISLTTIGFGDVTPTHPENMFIMFPLIIIGLSLVSMCINVVQLKLELLFEEMMLALMEEYEKTGQLIDGEMVVEPGDFQRGLGMAKMFKLWKKKRQAKRNSGEPVASTSGLLLPLMARNKRSEMLRELQRKAKERSIAVQTDEKGSDYESAVREWVDAPDFFHIGTQTEWMIEPGSPSLVTCASTLLLNGSSEEQFHSELSLFSHTHAGCQAKHSIQNPYIQTAGEKHELDESEFVRPWSSMDTTKILVPTSTLTPFTTLDKHVSTPLISAPKGMIRGPYEYRVAVSQNRLPTPSGTSYYYRTSPSAFAHHQHLDHGRYWLSGFRPEAPPGGGVPAMAIRRLSKDPSCDDFKTLIREIGCRLNECRHIVTQQQANTDKASSSK